MSQKPLDGQMPDEIELDDLDPEIRALLYPESDEGSKNPDKKAAPATGKKFRSRDGKEFDSIEAYEEHVEKRDKSADVKFRTAAKLSKIDDPDTKGKDLKEIDLSTIDPDDSEKLRDAIAHNDKVAKQQLEKLQAKFDSAEQAANFKESRKNLREIVRSEATKRGLKLNADSIDKFLDKAEEAESPAEQAAALMDLLEIAQNSATDETGGEKPKTDGGPIRVPGGGQGGVRREDVMAKAKKKMDELIESGKFYELPYLDQVNLGRAAVGEKPIPKIGG